MLTEDQRAYLFPKAYNAALRAGAAILKIYESHSDCEVTLKQDRTPLTEADCLSHNIIKEYLGQTRVPLLSEEGREMLYQERMGWDLYWMTDPLDGTKEFIKGNGEFTVNIALMTDNKPEIGIVYVPYIGRIYIADRLYGSFVREGVHPESDAEYSADEIYADAKRLPLTDRLNTPLRVAISRSHNTEDTFRYLDKIRKEYPDMQVIEQGSSYKFCMIAEGSTDCYVRTSPTYEWDTAAGELILELAGGSTVSLPDKKKLAYNEKTLVNPWFFCHSKYMPDI